MEDLQAWLARTAAERKRLCAAERKSIVRAAKKEADAAQRRAEFFARLGLKCSQ